MHHYDHAPDAVEGVERPRWLRGGRQELGPGVDNLPLIASTDRDNRPGAALPEVR
jgi:hypothetical protein